MTDTTTDATKIKKRSLVLPITAAVLAIAVGGFFVSRAGLDKALVKSVVDKFIADTQEKARAQGHDISITYGDLEVVGSFAHKHVVMHNPLLIIKPVGSEPQPVGEKKGDDVLRVRTDALEIYPESSDLSSLRILAPKPIDLAGGEAPDKSLLKITSDTPPAVTIGAVHEGEVEYLDIAYASPTKTQLTYLRETQAGGEEEKTPTLTPVYDNLTLTMAKGGEVMVHLAQDHSGLGKIAVNMQDLTITPEKSPGEALKLPKIVGEWSNIRNEKKLNTMRAKLDVGPITSADAKVPYQPVTLALDATYEGAVPNTPEAIANGNNAQESTITLKTLMLTTKDASLNATANFMANASDVVPVGTANIALTNLPYILAQLKEHALISEQSEPLVNSILQHVTGKPVTKLKDVTIPIERTRGGAFKIGNSTFDEIAALLFGQMIQSHTTPGAAGASHAPQLPPAGKQKSAPIEVPDHGARG